eukprot:maker-scaffold133_size323035-snap-gene-0.21 protein:Tk02227 transcript:maker-scaffold133_size323035-snap-gene-0.21-mRNA-1 annotation:"fibrinogen-like protein 1-like"
MQRWGHPQKEYFLGHSLTRSLLTNSPNGKLDLIFYMEDHFGHIKKARYTLTAYQTSTGSEADATPLVQFKVVDFNSSGVFRVNDAFSLHNDLPFATNDKVDQARCTDKLKSPGWFLTDPLQCALVNPFGHNFNSESAVDYQGVIFSTFRGVKNSLQNLVMAVKPHGESGDVYKTKADRAQLQNWMPVSKQSVFKTVIELTCPPGQSLVNGSDVEVTDTLKLTCGWDSEYERSHEGDLKCG